MRRALLSLGTLGTVGTVGTLVAAGCTTARSGADSAAARPDTAAATPPLPPTPAPAALDSPAATPSADSVRRAPAPTAAPEAPPRKSTAPSTRSAPSTPATQDSTTRPRLTPHPVPHRMPDADTTPEIQPTGGTQDADQAVVDRLMREAKALAHVDGCSAAGECAVQPLGARACGGPEDYVVYCPRSTDVAALKRKAAQLEREQKAFNAKYQIMSTCIFRQPPHATVVGGACRAASGGGAAAVPRQR
jgi:hypothetical protein